MIAMHPPAEPTQPNAAWNVRAAHLDDAATGNLWRKTVVLTQALGADEAFSIGPDNHVWHYRMGADRAGGGRLMSTGLRAEAFGAVTLPDGRRVVMAAVGREMHYCVESRSRQGLWEAPRQVALTLGAAVTQIESINLRASLGQVWINVATVSQGRDGEPQRDLWLGAWRDDRPVFGRHPSRPSSALEMAWNQVTPTAPPANH